MRKDEEKKILDGWAKIAKEYKSATLSDEEKAQIDVARLADEQSKRSIFTLGGSLRRII